MTLTDIEQQLIDLQTQLAFQEDTLQTLNDIVTRQQDELDTLRLRCEKLEQQYEDALNSAEQPAADERPPHY